MPRYSITFQSLIEVTRFYEADDQDEAKSYAEMDAEDGQIGPFPHDVVSTEITDCWECPK